MFSQQIFVMPCRDTEDREDLEETGPAELPPPYYT